MSFYSDSASQMVGKVHDATTEKDATGYGLAAVAFALLDVAEALREASRTD